MPAQQHHFLHPAYRIFSIIGLLLLSSLFTNAYAASRQEAILTCSDVTLGGSQVDYGDERGYALHGQSPIRCGDSNYLLGRDSGDFCSSTAYTPIGGQLFIKYGNQRINVSRSEINYTGSNCIGAENNSSGDFSEHQIDNPIVNLALGKTTSQSSIAAGGVSSRAVDGNTSGHWGHRSVTHTKNQQGAWWKVDLGSNHIIDQIKIYNRTDCCKARLSSYKVRVATDEGFNDITFEQDFNVYPNPSNTISIGGVEGRYVKVQLNNKRHLSLAEVQVMGYSMISNKGDQGEEGKSAYQIAVENGFVGTEGEWLLSLKGEQGEKGDQGDKGDIGPQGLQGIQGLSGAQGVQGEKGEKGDIGERGSQGVKGEQGLQGLQGVQGVQGLKGDKGDSGQDGVIGPQGLQGEKGDKGDTGEQGIQGVAGVDGQDGVNGDTFFAQVGTDVALQGQNNLAVDAGNLSVSGDVKFGSSGEDCTSVNEGAMRYNSAEKMMEFCDGSDWRSVYVNTSGSISLYYVSSTSEEVTFSILNSFNTDTGDKVKVVVSDGNGEVANGELLGIGAHGNKSITIDGLIMGTVYTAEAILIKENSKQIKSNVISFTTNSYTYDSGHILFSGHENGIITAEELTKVNPTKRLKITAIAAGGYGGHSPYSYDGERIKNMLFSNPFSDISITVPPINDGRGANHVAKGGDVVIGSLITLTGGNGNNGYGTNPGGYSSGDMHSGLSKYIINGAPAGAGGIFYRRVHDDFSGNGGYVHIEVE